MHVSLRLQLSGIVREVSSVDRKEKGGREGGEKPLKGNNNMFFTCMHVNQ